ncbi:hypothetical protein EGW08_014212 [Elysia chlorotica]|uniref:Uncharacterized protein n=1 Tax=Elysia chlorotica TaxID=188477 RepID=A0A3S0ZY45_ELYCH|nr:hypothetical protein EGW08_014212 [Elysia chlorotica]
MTRPYEKPHTLSRRDSERCIRTPTTIFSCPIARIASRRRRANLPIASPRGESTDEKRGYLNSSVELDAHRFYGGNPIVVSAEEGFLPDLPADKTVFDETVFARHGRERIYLHVYGRPTVYYVDILDAYQSSLPVLSSLIRPVDCTRYLNMINFDGLSGFMGGKLVYRRPAFHAVAGFRYMVKLYFGGPDPAGQYAIKKVLSETSNVFVNKLYNCAVRPYSAWLISKRAAVTGQLWIKSPPHVKSTREYKYVDVYYKDVVFDTGASVNFDAPLEKLRQTIDGIIDGKSRLTLAVMRKRIDHFRRNFDAATLGENKTLSSVRKSLLDLLFGADMKNGVENNRLRLEVADTLDALGIPFHYSGDTPVGVPFNREADTVALEHLQLQHEIASP